MYEMTLKKDLIELIFQQPLETPITKKTSLSNIER